MFRPDFPPHGAESIRHLSPDLKRSIKAAVRALCVNPNEGAPLVKEFKGLWKYRERRCRIVFAIDRIRKVIRCMAVADRRSVYEELAELVKNKRISE